MEPTANVNESEPRLKVTEAVIYLDREPTEAEEAAGVAYRPGGQLSQPDLVNRKIEDAGERARIPAGEGNISITIAPGDELGELSFNVQFEGRRGDYDFCLQHHNELLEQVSDLLAEILSDFGADFEVKLESLPCPKTELRVQLDLTQQILEGRIRQAKVIDRRKVGVVVEHKHTHEE